MGVLGLIVAGLLATCMSTFDSTVNATSSYYVKDIYQKFINPKATEKDLVKWGWYSSIGIVVLGILMGWFAPSINFIWSFITMGLMLGFVFPMLLRWWW